MPPSAACPICIRGGCSHREVLSWSSGYVSDPCWQLYKPLVFSFSGVGVSSISWAGPAGGEGKRREGNEPAQSDLEGGREEEAKGMKKSRKMCWAQKLTANSCPPALPLLLTSSREANLLSITVLCTMAASHQSTPGAGGDNPHPHGLSSIASALPQCKSC